MGPPTRCGPSARLVHGDVKLDNIGYYRGHFVLLDFGICRPAGQFATATQTGSLRTRAPEVLLNERSHSALSDVWALGATVFNFLLRGFPLVGTDEYVPKPTSNNLRATPSRTSCDDESEMTTRTVSRA
jgi:serine/threonine protein kinase